MESPVLISLLLAVMLVQATRGQTLNGPSSVAVERGTNTQLTCRVAGVTSSDFTWSDESVSPAVTMFGAGAKLTNAPKYADFTVSEDDTSSTLTITGTQIAEEGSYVCQSSEVENPAPAAQVTVEVGPTLSLTLNSTLIAGETYEADCIAVGSRPTVDINWYLGNVQQTTGIVTTNAPNAVDSELTDTTSTFTFIPTKDNFRQSLRCETTGHQLTSLNQQDSIASLNVHYPPDAGIMTVDFSEDTSTSTTELTVTCTIPSADEPNPFVTMFYIYENVTDNPSPVSTASVFTRATPDFDTEYLCVSGNYLGNTTATRSFVPGSTTTLAPTTDLTSGGTEPGSTLDTTRNTATATNPNTTEDTDNGSGNLGAIVGGVIGGLVVVGLIIVLCCCFSRCPDIFPAGCTYCCPAACEPICPSACVTMETKGSNTVHSTAKVSNGKESEQDSPLNEVITPKPQKMQLQTTQPVAAPRASTGPVKHTTNNPSGDEYAVVEKGPMQGSGEPDHVDYGVGGQNDPQLQYAELDMSNKAGHTDKRVPQNQNDVVVYSSILV